MGKMKPYWLQIKLGMQVMHASPALYFYRVIPLCIKAIFQSAEAESFYFLII